MAAWVRDEGKEKASENRQGREGRKRRTRLKLHLLIG